MRKKKKIIKVTFDINEGWDARAYDKRLHYFVGKRAICNYVIRYKPPYFDAGFIPDPDDVEILDYCVSCIRLLKNRRSHIGLDRFF